MRILVITNMYPPHHLGGYELACRDAVTRWRAHGHDVAVLTSDLRFDHAADEPGDEPGGERENSVHRALKVYWKDGVIVNPSMPERVKLERHNATALRRAIDDHRPDAVSLWHMGAVSLSIITQVSDREIPIVAVIYDDWLVYGPIVDGWTRVFGTRASARRIAERFVGVPAAVRFGARDTICFMSRWLERRALERSPLDLPQRQVVVYGGIDLATFSAADETARPWRGRLLVAGRIEERKGVHVAIEALAHLPDATLDIVGPADDAEYTRRLHERADALGIADRIRWTGPVSRAELAEAFAQTDVFVFPVTWDEPFGMVPLEAMACGAAVIGTGTGGSAEFLEHEVNCLRITKDDPSAIVDAVRRLAGDTELHARLVREGFATAHRFADTRYYDELEAELERAITS